MRREIKRRFSYPIIDKLGGWDEVFAILNGTTDAKGRPLAQTKNTLKQWWTRGQISQAGMMALMREMQERGEPVSYSDFMPMPVSKRGEHRVSG
jgi:hypothetical protein